MRPALQRARPGDDRQLLAVADLDGADFDDGIGLNRSHARILSTKPPFYTTRLGIEENRAAPYIEASARENKQ
jgi:hypothetical protein